MDKRNERIYIKSPQIMSTSSSRRGIQRRQIRHPLSRQRDRLTVLHHAAREYMLQLFVLQKRQIPQAILHKQDLDLIAVRVHACYGEVVLSRRVHRCEDGRIVEAKRHPGQEAGALGDCAGRSETDARGAVGRHCVWEEEEETGLGVAVDDAGRESEVGGRVGDGVVLGEVEVAVCVREQLEGAGDVSHGDVLVVSGLEASGG